MTLTRFIRRALLNARFRHHQREIAHLEQLRRTLGPALDRAIRARDATRVDLLFLDVHRAPASVAMSGGPRDGKVRPIREVA